MSNLADYSKFDHIDDGDDSSSEDGSGQNSQLKQPQKVVPTAPHQSPAHQPPVPAKVGMTRKNDEGRYVFEVDGRKIYEWEQSLEEVNICVEAPPGLRASQIICDIGHDRLRIGLRGSDRYFIDERTFGGVVTAESSWYLDDERILNIVLVKAHRGETWDGALQGRDQAGAVDPFTRQQMQKDLMLERFQEENPGFDFRGAEFNGEAPDPRNFMGGVKYS
uniref:CS domain-containing protein n=1 Tax=Odontella aurita TaxID=265563 RepID=A0A7S4NFY5_9STRA|mmetsp:Transcript_62532/g.184943  ORF Transcript_62532/g.184943 Transcript_62532/m.184943 type:complete len:220 (+) Transcript_62532:119-778(+)